MKIWLACFGWITASVAILALHIPAQTNAEKSPSLIRDLCPLNPWYELLAELLLRHNRLNEAQQACRQALLRAPNRSQSPALIKRVTDELNSSPAPSSR